MADKKELEIKNRILLDDLDAWQAHLEAMWGQKVPHRLLASFIYTFPFMRSSILYQQMRYT